jgi:uncharacterized BrkB/YihY/UPF0761 family membrane protein
MMWLFFSAVVFLFGAEIAATLRQGQAPAVKWTPGDLHLLQEPAIDEDGVADHESAGSAMGVP